MDIFDLLKMLGGLCLFLFGMNIMSDALERRAGNGLKALLGRFTGNKVKGFFTGIGVTAVIQSSSATTVMVVGFVNSGIMTLTQAINVIMGANVGTTITSWILSLGGIDSGNFFVQLLKPTSFTPILALVGVILLMGKTSKRKDTGTILLGFATLMFGMDTMSGAVKGLAEVEAFQQLFVMFENPLLGVLVGALLTAIIQSSSASVGILQALTKTGQVSNAAAIPIIMGQNIGTCVTAMLSSFGANKNAKRAALVHLIFNILGTVICLIIYYVISLTINPAVFAQDASHFSIAILHTAFNVLCTLILLPMSTLLEKLALKFIPDDKKREEAIVKLDQRLLTTPAIALERSHAVTTEMADLAIGALRSSLAMVRTLSTEGAEDIREAETRTDHYEDILGTYLLKLNESQTTEKDSMEISKLLKVIGDFERISDHSVNVVESIEEVNKKGIAFTERGKIELDNLCSAIEEILYLARTAFVENDLETAYKVEPLEQIIDELKVKMRNSHINRLKKSECSIEAGFVWSDLLTNLERTADHCSNIALCVIDSAEMNMNAHQAIRSLKGKNPNFEAQYESYLEKYTV